MLRRGPIASGRSTLATRTLTRRFGKLGDYTALTRSSFLAATMWQLGEVERARELIDTSTRRASELGHTGAIAIALFWKSYLEIWRGDPVATLSAAEALEFVAREYGMMQFLNEAELHSGWARGRINDPMAGAAQVRRVLAAFVDQGVRVNLGLLQRIAGGARGGNARRGQRAGSHRRSFRSRTKSNIVALSPSCIACAAKSCSSAIPPILLPPRKLTDFNRDRERTGRPQLPPASVLALAKLYQSTGRPVEAHAVLAPALEGFSPTPEMPEIAEAQALLAGLAETDEMKAEMARRRRLTELNIALGNALMSARGPGAPETTASFAKALDSAGGGPEASDRLAAEYGVWVGSLLRAELPSMKARADTLLADASARPDSAEAGVANRVAGITCWCAGDYRAALLYLESALDLFRPGRDDHLGFRFGPDPGAAALLFLAIVTWSVGEIDRAISFADRAQARMASLTHAQTLGFGTMHLGLFELFRGNRHHAVPHALELLRLGREHGMAMFVAFGTFLAGWAATAAGGADDGLKDMRRGVDLLRESGVLEFDGLLKMALAEAEAAAGDPACALRLADEALSTVERTGVRTFESGLHRVRGQLMYGRDTAHLESAEGAFRSAITVAGDQGARSFGLQAVLALAKLYQSTGRPSDAHAVLAPALEGFAPTPEFPEIEEAQVLLAAIEAGAHVRHE